MELNKCQTPLDKLEMSKEMKEKFDNYFYNIPFIRALVSSDRKYAKDLPRDEDGKIIVDLEHPHILENMDYFRKAAITFEKTGKYTELKPNTNPNSEYYKWVKEEVRRCHEGLIRPSDGEWVPGLLYYYLNYSEIQRPVRVQMGKSKKTVLLRMYKPPEFWDGTYWWYHYKHQAREEGLHCCMLSSRGRGKSFNAASDLSKIFKLGETKYNNTGCTCYITASDKKFLVAGDQTLDKFQHDIDYISQNTEWPGREYLANRLQDMIWIAGYKDLDLGNKGTGNSVVGMSSNNDVQKLRGTRAVMYVLEEAGTFANLDKVWSNTLPSVEQGQGDEREVFGQIIMYGCCCAGTKVWTSDGIEKNIEDLKLSDGILSWNGNNTECDIIRQQINLGKKQCVKLVTSAGRFLECSIDHPIYKATIHNYRNKDNKNKRDRVYEWDFVPAENLRIGDKVGIARHIESWGNEVLFDAYLTGVLIGDGSYGFDNTPKLSNEDVEILDYVKSNYDWSLNDTHITKKGRKYEEIRIKNICNELRNIGIYGQTKANKRLPLNYKNLTKEDTLKLIAGIIDTDGCVFYHNKNALCYINIVQSSVDILKQIQFLIRKLGATSSIEKVNPTIKNDRKDKNAWYKLSINGNLNIKTLKDLPLLVTRKKDALNAICNKEYIKSKHYNSDNIILDTIVDIQYLGEKEIYNMEVLNNHTYLANNFITHNTAGDKDSDFSSMGKMMYHPEGYHIKALHNIYDIEGKGAKQFSYFFPAYLNNAGCYDKNGNSDVTKALYQILKDRETIKKKSGDINAIVKRTAEYPIVPQEAIMRVGDNRFPIAEINERIMQLEENEHEYDDTLVGILMQNPDGTVKFKPTSDNVITMYPLGDNKAEGALQIFKLPEKDNNGLVYSERYVIGHDPVNQDEADSVSLSSTFVIDMYTNSIVAEFTGRRQFQDESFEQLRLLSMFYNAQVLYEANNKMCYSYFSKMNCTYMLADTPEYLRERDIVKKQGFGNSAKGVSATAILNKHEDDLIEQFLLLPKTIYEKTPDGEEVAVTIHNVKTIRNLALLRELSSYGPDGNFDRVRALGVTLMLKHAYEVKYGGDVQSAQEPDVYNVFEDDFFKRNGIIH